MKHANFRTNERTYLIPEAWLGARAHARELEGYDPIQAYRQALADWVDQEHASPMPAGEEGNT